MSLEDQAKKVLDQAQEGVSKATGNQKLQAEGVADQLEANVSQSVEDVKNKGSEVVDGLTGKAKSILG